MKSSTGIYFEKLDHIRALAAFLVFNWHYLHFRPDFPVPFQYSPSFPFSIFEEGHTGVSLFMTLSGYLFARLIGNKDVDYVSFIINRVLRLAPLTILVLLIWCIYKYLSGFPMTAYMIVMGFVGPTWPGGLWSITTEMHFYVLLPVILMMHRRFGLISILLLLSVSVLGKLAIWHVYGTVQDLAYFSIVGRLDEFLFGMLFAFKEWPRTIRSTMALITGGAFLIFWQWLDDRGGYFGTSQSLLWVFMPAVQGCTYGALISWYHRSELRLPPALNSFVTRIGTYSFSIYLLHTFPRAWFTYLTQDMTSIPFPVAFMLSCVAFVAILPIAALSYKYIEKPFLKFRVPYIKQRLFDEKTSYIYVNVSS